MACFQISKLYCKNFLNSFTSNTLIGYKLHFYRNMFHLDQISYSHFATARLAVTLNQANLGIINLITLLNVRAGDLRKEPAQWRSLL